VPPEALAVPAPARVPRSRLRLLSPPRPRIADVALFYGERSGGIRTYLDAKASYARATGAFEHHLLVPGPREIHEGGRHELPSLRLAGPNGYRLPLGVRALTRTLRLLRPDIVLLHDPFWAPRTLAAEAQAVGARVVAVHHGSSELDAAGLPGPSALYVPLLRGWLRRASAPVDAVMSVVDTREDCGRPADLPLRLGLGAPFRPQPAERRRDHVLYVGRLAREKGLFALLEAAARSADPWPLRLVGDGPAEDALRRRAARLGIEHRVCFHPFVRDREVLARRYAQASCVVMPGEHETFGLAALEAAACGAPVVTCATAPVAHELGALGHRFRPGSVPGLGVAIAAARAARPDHEAAAGLARRFSWEACFSAELADLDALGA
jgi:alpha-1,6-mannosyltransferase